jgi:N-terminal domain of galactosyltransferase
VKVCAIVPYRPDTPERKGNWERTRQQWEHVGWDCQAADSGGALFSRGRSINLAAARTDADVLCIADVDFLFDNPHRLPAIAELALGKCAHIVPYSTLHVLGPEASQQVRDGADPGKVPILESVGMTWVCAAMVSRELFDRVKGFDERFVGYGEEDLGFVASTGTMGMKMRCDGTAYHLSHGEPVKDHPLRQANRDLCSRYRGADGDQVAMQAIIDER